MCYICGREFGTASLDIHLKSCKKRWETEQAQKPLRERKPLPQPPTEMQTLTTAGEGSEITMKAYNDVAADQFNKKVLEKCDGCGRTFNPEALVKHQKSCGSGSGAGAGRVRAS